MRSRSRDGESAYTQAELQGPPTWVRIPRERWPQSWVDEGLVDPVCPLMLALYGHPDAGGFWERRCEKAVSEVGFTPDWPSVFFHKDLKLMLVIYVDDFKLAGPRESQAKGWELLKTRIKLEEPRPIGRYLGCLHERFTRDITGVFNPREEWTKRTTPKKDPPEFGYEKNENNVPRIEFMRYNMEDFMKQCVIRYRELCGELYPKSLEKAKMPYLDETKPEFDENDNDSAFNSVMGQKDQEVDEKPGCLGEHAPAVPPRKKDWKSRLNRGRDITCSSNRYTSTSGARGPPGRLLRGQLGVRHRSRTVGRVRMGSGCGSCCHSS